VGIFLEHIKVIASSPRVGSIIACVPVIPFDLRKVALNVDHGAEFSGVILAGYAFANRQTG